MASLGHNELRISLKEIFWFSNRISLKNAPPGPVANMSAVVHSMAWCPTGDKILPEPVVTMFKLYGITRSQWVNSLRPSDAYITIIGSDNHLLPGWTVPSHYLYQCWNIVNWAPRNKHQWNVNRNSNIFLKKNAFENYVCEMAAILSQPQCVNVVGMHACKEGKAVSLVSQSKPTFALR